MCLSLCACNFVLVPYMPVFCVLGSWVLHPVVILLHCPCVLVHCVLGPCVHIFTPSSISLDPQVWCERLVLACKTVVSMPKNGAPLPVEKDYFVIMTCFNYARLVGYG